MATHLFVYGTLKRGFSRHKTLQDQQFICCAATVPTCRLFDCGSYPGLLESSDGISVHGELYEVDAQCLLRCDAIEGVAEGLYIRKLIDVVSIDDASYGATAWAYFYQKLTVNLPECGCDWAG
ncbi:MAG: gamma-glutamylcyclotransferase family protein [Planctomycetaceae bacterium]|jgi:gamma-glutamylcyclotransferase (GGCT)/AIG2-like uncharacterized protein YtfP